MRNIPVDKSHVCEYTNPIKSQTCEIGGVRVVNVKRLREAMLSQNLSIEMAAKALGIDRATFYRRMEQNGARFTVAEVAQLADMLNLSMEDKEGIFFDRELA